ncbi:MAG: metallophosphoesterase [Clostridia bacterium]|nr:metallophosphoesterase [Clostridia bacterium]
MNRKIFAVSDIHGCCDALKRSLEEAGFVKNDDGCLLIVIGDCFDRGDENREVFDFLNGIKNKIIIRGNHEDMLEQLLEKKHIGRSGFSNGMDTTMYSFFGEQAIGDLDVYYQFSYKLNFRGRESVVEELRTFLSQTYDYFETEHYIFTHGWLPAVVDEEGNGAVKEAFRYETPSEWKRARFTEWYRMYGAGAVLKDKTIVCGHRTSRFACLLGERREPDDYSPFMAKGIAAIDTSTVQSGKVNVLVIEDELYEATHEMTLRADPFRRMRNGKKRVELRLLDEKRKNVRVGDRIVFTNAENEDEKIYARVIGLHAYPDFDSLASDFFRSEMGFEDCVECAGDIMRQYYSDADVSQYGALAIRVRIESDSDS